MAASSRGKPDISGPLGFNRIITPQFYSQEIMNLSGVKYILSFNNIEDKKDKRYKVYENDSLMVFENKKVYPRAFFALHTLISNSKQQTIDMMFNKKIYLLDNAIIENAETSLSGKDWSLGKVSFLGYKENKVSLHTENKGDGFLILTDSFYPTWHAKIDGRETKIYLTDFNFRGIIVPKGEHNIQFYQTLL